MTREIETMFKDVDKDSPLHKKAEEVLNAAYEYKELFNQSVHHAAVCWITDDQGHTFFFTRGEYADEIKRMIRRETRGGSLEEQTEKEKS